MVLALAAVVMLGLLVVFGIVSLISMQIARKSAAPFFPTPAKAIREALRAANLGSGKLFYDLGAGTGKALLIAEREFGAQAKGFEISILFYLIAKANLFLHRSKTQIVFESLFNQDLSKPDVIFCFLAERTMPTVREKLFSQLKPGARMIVYAFAVPELTPESTLEVKGAWKIFIYKK